MKKKYQMKSEYLDKWLAQLRDPKSKQVLSRYFDYGKGENAKEYLSRMEATNEPVCGCALGHLVVTIPELCLDKYGYVMMSLCNVATPDTLERALSMNDYDKKSLPEIADWLEANVERV